MLNEINPLCIGLWRTRSYSHFIIQRFLEKLFWDLRAGPNFTLGDGTPIQIGGVDQFAPFAALEALAVAPPVSSIEMSHKGLAWGTGVLENKLGNSEMLALATFATVPTPPAPTMDVDAAMSEPSS